MGGSAGGSGSGSTTGAARSAAANSARNSRSDFAANSATHAGYPRRRWGLATVGRGQPLPLRRQLLGRVPTHIYVYSSLPVLPQPVRRDLGRHLRREVQHVPRPAILVPGRPATHDIVNEHRVTRETIQRQVQVLLRQPLYPLRPRIIPAIPERPKGNLAGDRAR